MKRTLTAALLISVFAALPASGAPADRTTSLASPAVGVIEPAAGTSFAGASEDGSRVFFSSYGRLTPDDAESNYYDVYERAGGTTTLISQATGIPDPGNGSVNFRAASSDGSRVFFTTDQRLTAADDDFGKSDIYERAGGVTTLITQPTGVADPGSADIHWGGISKDGSRVFFWTLQKLTADDTDTNRLDVYERSGGTTKLVSAPTGAADPDSGNASYVAASADGTRVFFGSSQQLTAEDTDGLRSDVYERSGGTTKLVSTGAGASSAAADATLSAVSDDGTRVFFFTRESLSANDADAGRTDVYERSGGTTKLVSAATGVTDPGSSDANGLVRVSPDGERVLFETPERLVPEDVDMGRNDIYARAGGVTTLVSAATGVADPGTADVGFAYFIRSASTDATRVFMRTTQRLTPDDNDTGRLDVYLRAGGTTTLASGATGVADPNTADVELSGTSADGRLAFMTTTQRLTSDDADTNRADTYVSADGVTALLSKPADGADPNTADVVFGGNSLDGGVAVFDTQQQLAPGDTDANVDTYVSTAIPPPPGTPPPGTPAGDGGGQTPAAPASPARLELTGYGLFPRKFRAAPRGATASPRRRIGTRVTYTLSGAATVAFRVERAVGRRRYVLLKGTLKQRAGAGRNVFGFSGRLRGRQLRPGAYRLRARATDAAGDASPLVRRSFRVIRR